VLGVRLRIGTLHGGRQCKTLLAAGLAIGPDVAVCR
jgi:hypothetical protein